VSIGDYNNSHVHTFFQSIDANNTQWNKVEQDENSLQNKLDFKDGQHFILMIQFFEEHLAIRLNCGEEARLKFHNKLVIVGDYELMVKCIFYYHAYNWSTNIYHERLIKINRNEMCAMLF
jgi:hypothetical protein